MFLVVITHSEFIIVKTIIQVFLAIYLSILSLLYKSSTIFQLIIHNPDQCLMSADSVKAFFHSSISLSVGR